MTEPDNERKKAGNVDLSLLGNLLAEATDEISEEVKKLAIVEANVEALISWVDNELRPLVEQAVEVIQSLGERVDKIEQLLNKDVEK